VTTTISDDDQPRPRDRLAARILVISPEGRTLLFRYADVDDPTDTWWVAPGGGAEAGEDVRTAARRELFEETGLRAGDLGEVVRRRVVDLRFADGPVRQDEHFFTISAAEFVPDDRNWTELERATTAEHRWWSVEELRSASDAVFPEDLSSLLEELISARNGAATGA
jgi:8-oxo-dGTP pyrophosphatase MutT (NUDIX family)